MKNLNDLSETTRDIVLTIARQGSATIKDFQVIQSKRAAMHSHSWGYALLTEGMHGNGWRGSLIHRGIIYVCDRSHTKGRSFALTPLGIELVNQYNSQSIV